MVEQAFQKLKEAMTKAPMLALPHFTKPLMRYLGVGDRGNLTIRAPNSISQSIFAWEAFVVVNIREGDLGIGNGGTKMAALLIRMPIYCQNGPKKSLIFVDLENIHHCPTKVVIQTHRV